MSVTDLLGKLRAFVVKRYHTLVQIHDTPHAVAGGVAIGIFFGFLPLFIPFVPLKTMLTVLTSWALRCSKLAALIAVTGHDVLLPIWPLVLRWEYQIGYWLLHHHLPPKLHEQGPQHGRHLHPEHWFSMETYRSWEEWVHHMLNWKTFTAILGPMVIGSVIIGVPVATVCYLLTVRIVKRTQAALELAAAKRDSVDGGGI